MRISPLQASPIHRRGFGVIGGIHPVDPVHPVKTIESLGSYLVSSAWIAGAMLAPVDTRTIGG